MFDRHVHNRTTVVNEHQPWNNSAAIALTNSMQNDVRKDVIAQIHADDSSIPVNGVLMWDNRTMQFVSHVCLSVNGSRIEVQVNSTGPFFNGEQAAIETRKAVCAAIAERLFDSIKIKYDTIPNRLSK